MENYQGEATTVCEVVAPSRGDHVSLDEYVMPLWKIDGFWTNMFYVTTIYSCNDCSLVHLDARSITKVLLFSW